MTRANIYLPVFQDKFLGKHALVQMVALEQKA